MGRVHRERSRRRCCRSRRCRCPGVMSGATASARVAVGHALRRPMTYRRADAPDQIALQLYTVRDLAAADLPGTLEAVASGGLSRGGARRPAGGSFDELARRWLDDAGLRPWPPRGRSRRLRATRRRRRCGWPRSAAPASIVPWMPEADRQTHSRRPPVRRRARPLRRTSRGARDRARLPQPLPSSSRPLDGTTVWDDPSAELPSEIELELDVYWAAVGGTRPGHRDRRAPASVSACCT